MIDVGTAGKKIPVAIQRLLDEVRMAKEGLPHCAFDRAHNRHNRSGLVEHIQCPKCGLTSYDPNDIAQRYCGACHQFHADMSVS